MTYPFARAPLAALVGEPQESAETRVELPGAGGEGLVRLLGVHHELLVTITISGVVVGWRWRWRWWCGGVVVWSSGEKEEEKARGSERKRAEQKKR